MMLLGRVVERSRLLELEPHLPLFASQSCGRRRRAALRVARLQPAAGYPPRAPMPPAAPRPPPGAPPPVQPERRLDGHKPSGRVYYYLWQAAADTTSRRR